MVKPASSTSVGRNARAARAPAGGSRRLKNQLTKATSEWRNLEHRADHEELKHDINLIVAELKKDPRKVRGCRRATLSNLFLRSLGDDRFPDYSYLHRLPQDFAKPFLAKLDPKLSDEVYKHLRKNDRHVVLKMVYFALMLDSGDAFGPLQKSVWESFHSQPARDLGNPLVELKWGLDFKIDWASQGYFDLVENRESWDDRKGYTHIRFRKRIQACVAHVEGGRFCRSPRQ